MKEIFSKKIRFNGNYFIFRFRFYSSRPFFTVTIARFAWPFPWWRFVTFRLVYPNCMPSLKFD